MYRTSKVFDELTGFGFVIRNYDQDTSGVTFTPTGKKHGRKRPYNEYQINTDGVKDSDGHLMPARQKINIEKFELLSKSGISIGVLMVLTGETYAATHLIVNKIADDSYFNRKRFQYGGNNCKGMAENIAFYAIEFIKAYKEYNKKAA